MYYVKILLLVLLSTKNVLSANVLFVAAMASPSHHIWNRALAYGLAIRGHNVTHIGPDTDNLPKPENYTHILLEGVYNDLNDHVDINEMAEFSPTRWLFEFENWCIFTCTLGIRTQGLQTLLKYPDDFKFDLIVFDMTPGSCMFPLMKRFNYPPSVGVTAFLLPPFLSYSLGNSLYPSYLPWYGLPYSTEMGFMERVWNFIYIHLDLTLRHFYQYKEEHRLAKNVFGEDTPTMEELEEHISLVLVNTDPVLDHPQPITPNLIPVGGLHTRKSGEISKEFREILDNAKNGVIVMSLGTNVRSDKLAKDTQKAILDAFSKLQQTVIWKFESEMDNVPKNVIIKKWLPQNDILGHPNVKLFIGHGGALSTQEIVYHGKPIVAIPFIIDQYVNSKIIVNKKIGVEVDFKQITSEYFLSKVREVLDNPIYSENMKKLSKLYKDRPETPLERGIFWMEYVIRHGGAQSLNTQGRKLPFYKRTSLDVIVFLIVVTFVIVHILVKLILITFKLFKKSGKVKTQ